MAVFTRPGTRPSGPMEQRSLVRRRLPLIGAAVLLVAIGVTVGQLTSPGRQGAASEAIIRPEAPVESTPSPSPPVEPTTASSQRTREGAARAAARALSSLADPRLLESRAARRAVVARIAPSRYRRELDPLFDRTYDYLAGVLGAPAQRGEVVLRMTPLGYRVEAFTPRRATVAVWQVTLLATPERDPIAAWSTSRAELVWTQGRWTVERFGVDMPGPVPSVTAPAAPTDADEFVNAARGFSPFIR
jgi:hypothetical protein